MERYAGNDPDHYALQMAHRILNNTLGIKLVANSNAPGADVSTVGRQAAACKGCHYEGPFALDLIARLLPRVTPRNSDGTAGFDMEAPITPQTVLDKTVQNERDLVETLVASDQFKFNACRLAFKFLYGRAESPCESPLFDRCFDTFSKTGKIQDAVSVVATDPTYCP
jgi:hypothetical protein